MTLKFIDPFPLYTKLTVDFLHIVVISMISRHLLYSAVYSFTVNSIAPFISSFEILSGSAALPGLLLFIVSLTSSSVILSFSTGGNVLRCDYTSSSSGAGLWSGFPILTLGYLGSFLFSLGTGLYRASFLLLILTLLLWSRYIVASLLSEARCI